MIEITDSDDDKPPPRPSLEIIDLDSADEDEIEFLGMSKSNKVTTSRLKIDLTQDANGSISDSENDVLLDEQPLQTTNTSPIHRDTSNDDLSRDLMDIDEPQAESPPPSPPLPFMTSLQSPADAENSHPLWNNTKATSSSVSLVMEVSQTPLEYSGSTLTLDR